MRDYNVQVCVPSQEIWVAEFGLALTMMMSWSVGNRLVARSKSETASVISYRGSILPHLREKLVEMARKRGATHLLFVDSDQTFPKDTIRRLLGHHLPVVACNITVKQIPAVPTARLWKEGSPGGQVVYSNGVNGLQKVWRVGTGVMMIDMKVFDIVKAPYFSMYWDSEIGVYRGEDWVFCEKLEQAGIPIFVDHTLSLRVGHCGMYQYTHDLVVTKDEYETVREAFQSAA